MTVSNSGRGFAKAKDAYAIITTMNHLLVSSGNDLLEPHHSVLQFSTQNKNTENISPNIPLPPSTPPRKKPPS